MKHILLSCAFTAGLMASAPAFAESTEAAPAMTCEVLVSGLEEAANAFDEQAGSQLLEKFAAQNCPPQQFVDIIDGVSSVERMCTVAAYNVALLQEDKAILPPDVYQLRMTFTRNMSDALQCGFGELFPED